MSTGTSGPHASRFLGAPRDPAQEPLALRVAAALWATAIFQAPLYLLLPFHHDVPVVLLIVVGVGGLLIGGYSLRAARRPPRFPVNQWLLLGGIALVAVVVSQVGGADSPTRIYYVPQIVYAATFYRSPVFLLAISGAMLAPLAYDDDAFRAGYGIEAALAIPTFAVTWAAIAHTQSQLLGLRRRAEHESVTDELTGLLNRRGFATRLQAEPDAAGTLLFCDLDHFKDVNDRYGHEAGDRALQHLADAIRATKRTADVAARFGGEEFVVWLGGTPVDQAVAFAERLRRTTALVTREREPFAVAVSIGLTHGRPRDLMRLTAEADAAMFAAKVAGRDRVAVFDSPHPRIVAGPAPEPQRPSRRAADR